MRREMVDDCEAFLLGSYEKHLESQSLPVPVWAWLNVLAHGSADEIRAAADESRVTTGGWRAARAYLAAELLVAETRGQSLASLQRDVLVPLELQLAARPDVRSWAPPQWVAAVRSSIDTYGHSTRS